MIDLDALPEADALPTGDPEAPAGSPGPAPSGDARSLRGQDASGVPMFAVVYRRGAALVIGRGRIGRRGTWSAVEYPEPGAASHAYAHACAELVAAGYLDVA